MGNTVIRTLHEPEPGALPPPPLSSGSDMTLKMEKKFLMQLATAKEKEKGKSGRKRESSKN